MSSYFDDASLVMIPSGYKTSKVYSVKPTDGTGDLTFTRTGDTASRVASNGLIEKVRTNLLLQSNTFSTTWVNFNTTETSGQAGYDGTSNAWLLENTAASGSIRQTIASSGVQTYSFYAKKGTTDWVALYVATSGSIPYCFFDLTNGVKGATQNNVISSSITSVGNDWYRVQASFNTTTTDVRIFPAEANAVLASQVGDNIYIQDAQLEAGDIATQPISTTTAAVSVGPVANVPRLDYLNSSCPRLLLEPQTTALNQFSEQIDNAWWSKSRATVVANTTETIDPSGYYGADKLIQQSGFTTAPNFNRPSLGGAGNHTASVFVKKGTFTFVALSFDGVTYFDIENGTIGNTAAAHTPKIEDYGNGWYRCSVTNNLAAAATFATYPCSANGTLTTPDTEGYAYFWGANVTATAYLQSYIPTLGAAVTRGADACSKTGISSLIGQTEGTMFVEAQFDYNSTTSSNLICVHEGTSAAAISINRESNNRIQLFVFLSAVVQANIITTANSSGTYKIAATYKQNDFKLYVNGVSIGTDTSGNIPAPSVFGVGNLAGSNIQGNVIKQALIFPTALNATQLAELTTI